MSWFGYDNDAKADAKNRRDAKGPAENNSEKAQSSKSWWSGWEAMPMAPRGPGDPASDVPTLDIAGIQPGSSAAGRKPGEVIARAGEKKAAPERDRVYRERVLVRVYHLNKTVVTRALNRNFKSYGAFHTGVEVYGREWSFGMTFDDWSTGITWNPPGENPDHTFGETLSMGYTTLSPTQVWQLIEEMKTEWRGCTYHLLSRNCHHFSDAFCQKLGVNRIPSWLNELAGTGAATVEFLDTADSGYDGGEALVDFFSGIRRSVTEALGGTPEPLPTKKPAKQQQTTAAPPPQRSDRDDARRDPFSALR